MSDGGKKMRDPSTWSPEEYQAAAKFIQEQMRSTAPDPRSADVSRGVIWYRRNKLGITPEEDTDEGAALEDAATPATGDAPTADGEPKVVEVTAEDGGPIRIEGEVPKPEKPAPTSWWEALGRGAADSASFGFSDEAAGAGAWLAGLTGPDVQRDPRGDQSGYSAMRDQYRADDAKALQDQRGAFRGGQVGGALLTAAAPMGPAAAANATRAARLGKAAIGGALAGGLSAAGSSTAELTEEPGQLAKDTAAGAATGAVVGPVLAETVPAVVGAVGKGAKAVSDTLRKKANINRLASSGTYGAQLRNIAQNKGDDAVQALGEDIERLGIHKGKGMLGFLPQPPDVYAENASRVLDDAGSRMGAAETAIAQSADPPISVAGIDDSLRSQADDMGRDFDPASDKEASFMRTFADRIYDGTRPPGAEGPSVRELPFSDALKQRRTIDKNIDWTRRGGGAEAPMQEQVRRSVAGDLRASIREGLDDAAARGDVAPETVAQWKQANADYATAATVHEPAMARVYQEYGNQKIGLPGWLAALSGANIAGGPGVMAGMAAGQVAKSRGTPALAGVQRAGQRAFGKVGDVASDAAQAMALRPRAGVGARAASEIVPQKMAPAFADPEQQQAQPPRDAFDALGQAASSQTAQEVRNTKAEATQNGKGHELYKALDLALRINPQNLGKYREELQKAFDAGPVEAAAALDRLGQSHEFRESVLPRLQQIAREQTQLSSQEKR